MLIALRSSLCALAACTLSAQAQHIDISLHATAVPDSFEIRLASSGPTYTSILNGIFTVRWDAAAGGVISGSDVRVDCSSYNLQRLPLMTHGDYRYATFFVDGRALLGEDCPITSTPERIGSFRIRQTTGCHRVGIVNDAFTALDNRDYYLSVGGVPLTGQITSGFIDVGDCDPCVPPVITGTEAVHTIACGTGPLQLGATVSTSPVAYAWRSPLGVLFSFDAAPALANGMLGFYTVVVSNTCGSDTATVAVEPDPDQPCIPPQILSIPTPPAASGDPLVLQATVSGSCATGQWSGPGVLPGQGGSVNTVLPNGQPGVYTLIVHNACGADTGSVTVTGVVQGPCSPPTIAQVVSNAPTCAGDPLTLDVIATAPTSGGQNFTYRWFHPDGDLMSTGHLTNTLAEAGTYVVIVNNSCGSDTEHFSFAFDTTGLAACVPPEVLGITDNGPLCAGDTLRLNVVAATTGPCLRYRWDDPGLQEADDGTYFHPDPHQGTFILVVSNACGADTVTHVAPVIADFAPTRSLCETDTATAVLDLETFLMGHIPGGHWTHDGLPHPPVFDPATDTTGIYIYHDPLGLCPDVSVTVNVYRMRDAGSDGAVTLCSNDAPVDLFDHLGGTPEPGGIWSFGLAIFSGIYDPAARQPYPFRYTVQGQINACSDRAIVTVTENQATAWYADTDNDGFGDAQDSLMSCAPLPDRVGDASDDCPTVPGRIGDACDDGLPATINDVISPDCVCAGEVPTAITEVNDADIRVWPNPNPGDRFFLRLLPYSGTATLDLLDPLGRSVMHEQLPRAGRDLIIDLPAQLAPGTYVVRVSMSGRVLIRPLTVR